MPIFKKSKNKLIKLKEKRFDYERDLQKLVEQNLEKIFGLEFISGNLNGQFSIRDRIIDTLAFDTQTKSFVIIEYKKDRSFSIIDQGYTYLSLLLNNKAESILHYNEIKNSNLRRDEVDWSQSRVIFIAKEFTPYQRGAIEFRDLPIELWEVQLLESELVSFAQIKPAESRESITTVTRSQIVKEVVKEVKTFDLRDHYKKASPATRSLLDKLREKILALDENVKENPVQNYLGYKLNWYNFASIHVFKNKLKIHVRKSKLKSDTKKKFKKIPASYKWGKTPLWVIDISKDSELNYLMDTIKESYEAAPDR